MTSSGVRRDLLRTDISQALRWLVDLDNRAELLHCGRVSAQLLQAEICLVDALTELDELQLKLTQPARRTPPPEYRENLPF